MNLLLKVQYHVSNANDFVKNVSDESNLIRTVVQQSTVAEAAPHRRPTCCGKSRPS